MKSIIALFIFLIVGQSAFAGSPCTAPWGAYVPDGGSVQAYREQRPTGGARCDYQWRQCNNGFLSGWYNYGSCQEDYSCYTPEFGYMSHYSSVTAYFNPDEWNGRKCQSEIRTCMYGQLSGSYRYRNCFEHN